MRHPLDVVLSVFSNALTHGYHCANSLDTAAQHYALVADLIAHYRAVLPLNYYAVRYEELVADQEGEVRKLLEFIGEPFDPATLAFHENARPARTASYAQVTEKLYTLRPSPLGSLLLPAVAVTPRVVSVSQHSASDLLS